MTQTGTAAVYVPARRTAMRAVEGVAHDQVRGSALRHADRDADVLRDDPQGEQDDAARRQDRDDGRGPARRHRVVGEAADDDDDHEDQRDDEEERPEDAHGAQAPGAAGEHHPPEVREEAAGRVARLPLALVAQRDVARRDPVRDPAERDVEVDARPRVRGDAPADGAEHQPVALELLGVLVRRHGVEDDLRAAGGDVAEEPVRGRVGGLRVDDRREVAHGDVEHVGDEARVVLAVLVERDDPVPARRGHAREGRGVLPEVAAQPDRADEGVQSPQLADDAGGPVAAVVEDEEDLGDGVAVAVAADLRRGERLDLGEQRLERELALVYGDDDGDGVVRGEHGLARVPRLDGGHAALPAERDMRRPR